MKTAATILALFLALPSAARAEDDIVDTAVSAGSFKTLVAALRAAQLDGALRGDGPFTVFAPTDDAFAALPEGAVANLLLPENRDRLRAVLLHHVVAGRIRAEDLAPVAGLKSLGGTALPVGLRIGEANVTKANIECGNGVIHVIDRVLLPPRAEADRAAAVMARLVAAIETGAPMYNAGDPTGCMKTYEAAATELLDGADLRELHRRELRTVVHSKASDARERAWALRDEFDRIALDLEFEPLVEASLPAGFPLPGPVGKVMLKEYPAYRAARSDGRNSFWTLFSHIKRNDVQMTAPVEMTMDDRMQEKTMAFLYERPGQGAAGRDGAVDVVDVPPVTVLSIGIRGSRTAEVAAVAKSLLLERLEAGGFTVAGEFRTMGYNSPMVPAARQYWELQVPVTR